MSGTEPISSWFDDEDTLVRELRRGRSTAAPPVRIPGYEDLQELRRGGQGVVFLARQISTRRTVAVKILLDGTLATPKARRRFEREIDLVAGLRHPNIVRVYDSGRTDDDRLYFIMEYIEGIGVDRLIEDLRPTLGGSRGAGVDRRDAEVGAFPRTEAELISMFAKICDGVHFAHQQGVIHRDLKPSNIRIDRSGVPHVLDFGLAKASEEDVAQTQVSRTGGFLGSVPWASPEQAEGSQASVDVRSDVYALGVILYQILTGEFPYRLDGTLREALEAISQTQPTPIRELRRSISDELATIVSKCLAKSPDRRYQSAGALALDLRHYLAGEPIEAKRDSAWYSVRKRLDRYKTAVRAVSVLLAASIVFSVAMVWLRNRAIDAEQLAARRLAEVEAANRAEVAARKSVEAQVAKTAQVRDFLDVTLRAVDPWKHPGKDLGPLQEMLENAVKRLEGAFVDQPEVEAAIAATLGADFRELGLYDSAEALLQRSFELYRESLGEAHVSTLKAMDELAKLLTMRGRYGEAQTLFHRLVEIERRTVGPDDAMTLATMNNMALNLNWQGRSVEAAAMFRETLAAQTKLFGVADKERLSTLNNLATCLVDLGEMDEGERLSREVIEGRAVAFGADHPETLTARQNLAYLILRRGRFAEAEAMMRELLEKTLAALGPAHPVTLIAMHNLADAVAEQGKLTEGYELARKAYAAQLAYSGPDDPATLNRKNEMSTILIQMGRWDEAIPLARELFEQSSRVLGAKDYRTLNCAGNLAFAYNKSGRTVEAEAIWKQIIATEDSAHEAAIPSIATARANLGGLCADQGRWEEAESYYRAAIAGQERLGDADHWRTAIMRGGLGRVLMETGRPDEAEGLLVGACAALNESLGEEHAKTQQVIGYLVQVSEKLGKADQAAVYRGRLVGADQ